MAPIAELADIIDQRTRVADAESSPGVETGQGVARSLLVGIFPIIETENVGQVVFRVLLRAETTVVLTRLENNGVPSVLTAIGLGSITVPFWPIEGLMVVPETTYVNVGVTETVRGIRKKEGGRKCQNKETPRNPKLTQKAHRLYSTHPIWKFHGFLPSSPDIHNSIIQRYFYLKTYFYVKILIDPIRPTCTFDPTQGVV
jgi:hypothetical protein